MLWSMTSFATKIEGKISGLGEKRLYLLRLQGMGFTQENTIANSDNEGNFSFDIHLSNDEMLAISDEKQSFYMQMMVSASETQLKIVGEIKDGKIQYKLAEGSLASRFQMISNLKNVLLRRQDGIARLAPYYEQNSPQTVWMQDQWASNAKQLDSLQTQINSDKSELLAYYFEIENKLMAMFQADETKALSQFYTIDFADARLFKTGLIRSLIDQQIKLLDGIAAKQGLKIQDENYYKTIDHIVDGLGRGDERNTSSTLNYLMNGFTNDKKTNYINYLSDKSLEVVSCAITDKTLDMKLKQNSLLKVGNTMPDIDFVNAPFKKLSDSKAENTVLLFWSSECSHCQEEMPKLKRLYPILKEKGVELITISLDTNQDSFKEISKDFKWINLCDFKSIESPMVKDYYITSTPSLFMVGNDLKLKYKNQVNIADALAAVFGIDKY